MINNVLFIFGMFFMFLIFSLYFVGCMYSYKKKRIRNDTDIYINNSDLLLWLSLPLITYLFFFRFLNNKLIK